MGTLGVNLGFEFGIINHFYQIIKKIN